MIIWPASRSQTGDAQDDSSAVGPRNPRPKPRFIRLRHGRFERAKPTTTNIGIIR